MKVLPRRLFYMFGVFIVAATGYAVANPGIATCAMANVLPMKRLSDHVYRLGPIQSGSPEVDLVAAAQSRIEKTFGGAKARPITIFWKDGEFLSRLGLSTHGSTQFIAARACVLIGPKGHVTDVVAHEMMHAEVFDRIGFWARFRRLPVWIDEGIAMQVDYRARYNFPLAEDSNFVRKLDTATAFFAGDDVILTRNYAAAKSEVARRVAGLGMDGLYPTLERVRDGGEFGW